MYWFACACRQQKIAYLYALAVEKSCRGRGIGTQLMEKVHAVLAAQGYAGAVLVPQEEGLKGLYARLGYREGPGIETFTCKAGDTEISLRAISAAEYATLLQKMVQLAEKVSQAAAVEISPASMFTLLLMQVEMQRIHPPRRRSSTTRKRRKTKTKRTKTTRKED
jgi:predicted acetyltransferase